MNFKKLLAEKITESIAGSDFELIYSLIEIPPQKDMGDFSIPCFRFAKEMKKSPPVIAGQIANDIKKPDFISEIKTEGAYINFFVEKSIFATAVMDELVKQGEECGRSDEGKGKTIVIDYSSPNIAKPFHVGHLRSTVIGGALLNIYKCLGYDVVGINHLGDWGTQFGKLIVAYRKWGNKEEVEKGGIQELTRLYVKFHDESESDATLADEARSEFVKMQNGEPEAMTLWKWFNDLSIVEFEQVYKKLGIEFDYYTGESFYNDKMDAAIDELRQKNLLVNSEGAMVVDLSESNMPPCLILRTDGGTLYPTRDISAALYRQSTFKFDKCLYVTAIDQSLHFAQWFKVVERMGYDWANSLVHVPFGLVSLETGKLSTRKGNVVLMADLLNEAVQKTREIIEQKNPNLEDKEKVANQVGIGSVIFNDLFNSRIKDVVFSWDKMLNFEGETAPYVQYAHARACGVLEKADDLDTGSKADFSTLTDDASLDLIKLLYGFPAKISEAGNKYEPFVLTRHLVAIAQSFNRFYHENEVLTAAENVKAARLALVKVVKSVLRTGLNLLGVAAPEGM